MVGVGRIAPGETCREVYLGKSLRSGVLLDELLRECSRVFREAIKVAIPKPVPSLHLAVELRTPCDQLTLRIWLYAAREMVE